MRVALLDRDTGQVKLSSCCGAAMEIVEIELASPNCPFPITMPDHPIYALQCTECGEICSAVATPEPREAKEAK